MRSHLTVAIGLLFAGCVPPADPPAASRSAALTTADGIDAAGTIGDLLDEVLDKFGNITDTSGVLQLVGLLDTNGAVEKGISQIENQLTQIYGEIVNEDGLRVLEAVDADRAKSILAFDDILTWVSHGRPANDSLLTLADQDSGEALYDLAINIGLQKRLVNGDDANVPAWCGASPTNPDPTCVYSSRPNFYISNGVIWDYRLFLPTLMDAVVARLTVIEAKYPGFATKFTDGQDMINIINLLQPIADKIASSNDCYTSTESQTGITSAYCHNDEYFSHLAGAPNLIWSADMAGLDDGAGVAAAMAERDKSIGLTQLRAMIAKLGSYAAPPVAPPPPPPVVVSLDAQMTSLEAGQTESLHLTTSGPAGNVTFSAAYLPAGVTAHFQDPRLAVGKSTYLSLWADASAAPGLKVAQISAKSDNGLVASTNLVVQVTACQPVTSCGTTCGTTISNGCGGTLKCAACPSCKAPLVWSSDDGRCEAPQKNPPPKCIGKCI